MEATEMPYRYLVVLTCGLTVAAADSGCRSPYYADQGALFGGLTGAGLGAIVGNATGNTGAGAAIGAGLGTLTGATVGGALDDIEARNQARIEAQLGRPVRPGAVTIDDVMAMTASGVDSELIVNHIRANGAAQTLQANDLIRLQQSGVPKDVIAALQTATPPEPRTVIAQPRPVIVEEHYYSDPWGWGWGHPYHHHYYRRPGPRVGWGVSFSN